MNAIKAVLFDFGGVLAEEGFSNGLEALAREQQLEVEDMTGEGMRAVHDSGFVLGKGSESAFWSLLRARTGLQGSNNELHTRMMNGFIIRTWMLALVKKLGEQGYVTGILSDQTDWLDKLDAKYDFYRYFDHIYNSYYIGKGKHDSSHFHDVASNLELAESAIVFIDDSKANVDRAEVAGMHALLYVDRDSFIAELQKTLGIELLA